MAFHSPPQLHYRIKLAQALHKSLAKVNEMNGIQNTADMSSILVAVFIALSLVGGLVIVQKSWRAFLRWKAEQYHTQNHRDEICQERDGIAP